MTTRPTVSRAQLEVLEAADADALVLSQRRGESYPHWRIRIDEDITKPVTRSAESVRARGLLTKTDRFVEDDPDVLARGALTAPGRALLEDFASREPKPEGDR